MGIFAKRCSVCGAKLPDKRQYKGVCNPCGIDFHRLKAQLFETAEIVDRTKNSVTGFHRCVFGLGLSDDFARFVKAGLSKFPNAPDLEHQRKFLADAAIRFADDICQKNEKRKYSKKVGIHRLSEYKRLYHPTSRVEPGSCKSCYKVNGELNEAGYCRDCISLATSLCFSDFEKLAKAGRIPADGLEETFRAVKKEGGAAIARYVGMKLDLAQIEEKSASK